MSASDYNGIGIRRKQAFIKDTKKEYVELQVR